jgi:hypothetical protein
MTDASYTRYDQRGAQGERKHTQRSHRQ